MQDLNPIFKKPPEGVEIPKLRVKIPDKPRKPPRKTCAHCRFCFSPIEAIPEFRYSRGRLVVFCGFPKNCFKKYIEANPPLIEPLPTRAEEISRRAMLHLREYKTQVLFLPQDSHERLHLEGVIYELTEILEGRQRVTIQERSPRMQI